MDIPILKYQSASYSFYFASAVLLETLCELTLFAINKVRQNKSCKIKKKLINYHLYILI